MILIFLGSWRSTLIIAVVDSALDPVSLFILSALGETINIMTLGGFALAVGILVDDATVEIENINRNIEEGKEVEQAILDGAAQIAVPAFVSTLSICIVFVPMFFLTGVARYLFVPLAEAVSSRCSRPISSRALSCRRWPSSSCGATSTTRRRSSTGKPAAASSCESSAASRRGSSVSAWGIAASSRRPWPGPGDSRASSSRCAASRWRCSSPGSASDFFPAVDSGQIKLHLRARTGTRIEETARLCDSIDGAVREVIPPDELDTIIDNIGVPYSGLNLSYSNSAPIGPSDADILISMKERHRPAAE